MIMENMMKKYIGAENYSYTNHIKNFCLYWLKASKGSGDEWRKENDLDCLYFNGDLRADTLMSAWTPIKWVADFLNKDKGKKFYKHLKNEANPCRDLELLYENCDMYMPRNHELVYLLEEFLTLAEQRCNYILLPDRRMNCDRYHMNIDGKEVWLYDSVPATLYHVFNEKTLGKYFTDISPEAWIKREHLTVGFVNSITRQDKIIKMPGFDGKGSAKWLDDEESITKALQYMIAFLEARNAEIFNIVTLEDIYAKLIERGTKYFYIEDISGKTKIIKKVYASNIRREYEMIHDREFFSDFIFGPLWEERIVFDINYTVNGEKITETCVIKSCKDGIIIPTEDEIYKDNKIAIKWD